MDDREYAFWLVTGTVGRTIDNAVVVDETDDLSKQTILDVFAARGWIDVKARLISGYTVEAKPTLRPFRG